MSDRETIAKLRAEADALEQKIRTFENMPLEEQLAITLHTLLCTGNHTDACSWEYEFKNNIPDWNQGAHRRYLTKSLNVMACCARLKVNPNDVIEVIKVMKA